MGLVVALVAGIVFVAAVSVQRLGSVAAGRRPVAIRAVAAAVVVCLSLAVPGVPVYSDAAATSLVDHARRVQVGLNDREVFAAEASADAFRGQSGLLSSLQGKDVVFTFVEFAVAGSRCRVALPAVAEVNSPTNRSESSATPRRTAVARGSRWRSPVRRRWRRRSSWVPTRW
ncbi:hypothetical protein [Lentzea albidocapillata]|uniref:hypothetical protein n=1 Tax=Lentzea albidocapillata TaxID=40571 RepID=UPI00156E123B|nr:hypothetical protein [Lentzea albidocapillata]